CRCRRRSGMMRSSERPVAASAAWPKIRSAPRFQKRMIPSQSAATMASARVDSTACATSPDWIIVTPPAAPRRDGRAGGVGGDGGAAVFGLVSGPATLVGRQAGLLLNVVLAVRGVREGGAERVRSGRYHGEAERLDVVIHVVEEEDCGRLVVKLADDRRI